MDWLQLILSLIGVIGLILMLFYALRKFNNRVSVGDGNRMRVIDRINLGRDGMMLVVSVCGRLMLVGVTAQRIEKICDLDITEGEYFPAGNGHPQQDFKTILANVLGKSKKNTQDEDRFDLNNDIKDEKNAQDSEKTE